jgi:hypothetical protein
MFPHGLKNRTGLMVLPKKILLQQSHRFSRGNGSNSKKQKKK